MKTNNLVFGRIRVVCVVLVLCLLSDFAALVDSGITLPLFLRNLCFTMPSRHTAHEATIEPGMRLMRADLRPVVHPCAPMVCAATSSSVAMMEV